MDGAQRPLRRLPPDQRRAQLLDVALDLAADGDVAAISVADLAAAAGVSEGLLYHYFPTKQALVTAAVQRAADELMQHLETATGGSPAERLASGLSAYLDHVVAQPTGWRALLGATGGDLAAVAADLERRSRSLILGILDVSEPGPGLVVALAGWEAMERTACAAWLDGTDLPRAALEDMLTASLLATLTAAARHDPTAASALALLVHEEQNEPH